MPSAPLASRRFSCMPPLISPFAAPECQQPALSIKARFARRRGNHCELAVEEASLPAGSFADSPFAVNDWFAVQHDALVRDRFVVESVQSVDGCWLVIGRLHRLDENQRHGSRTAPGDPAKGTRFTGPFEKSPTWRSSTTSIADRRRTSSRWA